MSGNLTQAARIRIAFVGDVMLGRLVSRELHRRSPESFWGDVRPLLQSCDATIANLECAITRHKEPWARTRKVFHFGADPAAIDVLKAANIRAVSLANNHVLDFELTGLMETLQMLDASGIAHAGAGVDEAAARQRAMITVGPLKLALFACVDHERPFAASSERAGTAYVSTKTQNGIAYPDATQVGSVREEGADLVVLSCHFGANMVTSPSPAIASYRRAAVARGVDIVHGHSAHIYQGVERCKRSLILHDTGDFLDDYAVDEELRNDQSFVFVVEADATGPRKLALIPVSLELAHVRLATEREAEAMFDRMTKLSVSFDTHLQRSEKELALELELEPV